MSYSNKKPEIQLQQQQIDTVYPMNNIAVPAGTVIARVYFPPSYKGKAVPALKNAVTAGRLQVIYSSRRDQYKNADEAADWKGFCVQFIAPNPETIYKMVHSSLFTRSNMSKCRVLTNKLLNSLVVATKAKQTVQATTKIETKLPPQPATKPSVVQSQQPTPPQASSVVPQVKIETPIPGLVLENLTKRELLAVMKKLGTQKGRSELIKAKLVEALQQDIEKLKQNAKFSDHNLITIRTYCLNKFGKQV